MGFDFLIFSVLSYHILSVVERISIRGVKIPALENDSSLDPSEFTTREFFKNREFLPCKSFS